MSEWIDVKDRLPDSQQKVVVSAISKWNNKRLTLLAAHIEDNEITTDAWGWYEYEGETIYDEENDCFWIPECWYECNIMEDNENYIIDDEYNVTHWMPLPEPPKGVVENDR